MNSPSAPPRVSRTYSSLPRAALIVQMLDELQQAVKIAEHGLLNLKRSRLLRQIGIMEGADANPPSPPLPDSMPAHHHLQLPEDHIRIPDLTSHPTRNSDAAPEQTAQSESKRTRTSSSDGAEVGDWPIDSKCRFRHRDGRWYTGVVMAKGSDREEDPDWSGAHSGEVLLQFAHPTREAMKVSNSNTTAPPLSPPGIRRTILLFFLWPHTSWRLVCMRADVQVLFGREVPFRRLVSFLTR